MPEKEYIERKKLNDLLGVFCMSESLYEILQTIPTADVQPVKHGRWICIGDYDENIYECSNCHEIWIFNYGTPCENNANYCFYCGAKMDGGEK